MDLATTPTASTANGHTTMEAPTPALSTATDPRFLSKMEIMIMQAKELIRKREEIDEQLSALFGGQVPQRKERQCGKCGGLGHNSKTCTA